MDGPNPEHCVLSACKYGAIIGVGERIVFRITLEYAVTMKIEDQLLFCEYDKQQAEPMYGRLVGIVPTQPVDLGFHYLENTVLQIHK